MARWTYKVFTESKTHLIGAWLISMSSINRDWYRHYRVDLYDNGVFSGWSCRLDRHQLPSMPDGVGFAMCAMLNQYDGLRPDECGVAYIPENVAEQKHG